MERILHQHWDCFVTQLLALPVHPDQEEWALAQQAKALLEQLEAQHFDLHDLVDLSDEVFAYAYEVVTGQETASPIARMTAEAIADDPEDPLFILRKLHAEPDPSVAEVFV